MRGFREIRTMERNLEDNMKRTEKEAWKNIKPSKEYSDAEINQMINEIFEMVRNEEMAQA